MKTLCLILIALFAAGPAARGDVEISVSIKVILGPADEWPDNTNTIGTPPDAINLNSAQMLRDNITFTNEILARHGTGWRLVLRENTIYKLSEHETWFTSDARTAAFRDAVEDAALVDANSRTFWKWHDDSINIYLNDSRSGYCSSPGDGRSAITIGAGAYRTLIIHEIGHFLNLPHTHNGADGGETNTSVDDWGDGDGLSETLDDDKDATAAQINARYDGVGPDGMPNGETFFPQAARDDLIFNIMSYHIPQDRFVWQQREEIVETFNNSRADVTTGRARFVQTGGNNAADGLTVANRLATIGRAANVSSTPNDTVLIFSGTYNTATQGLPLTLTKPMTFSAWRGPVTLTR